MHFIIRLRMLGTIGTIGTMYYMEYLVDMELARWNSQDVCVLNKFYLKIFVIGGKIHV